MKPLCLSLFLLLFSVVSIAESAIEPTKVKFTMTTFNIAFYGIGGTPYGTSQTETRDPYLKEFLKNSVPASDIFVFEEIVDVPRLTTLLPSGWECLSYESTYANHQHVVLCHSPRFQFLKEPSDDNYLIDEVAGERRTLRPAVTAIVADKEGHKLFRIVWVHLKATPEYSKTRQEQAVIISHYLEKLKGSNLPIVIAGDFNTFDAPANRETANDKDLILNIFNTSGLGIARIPNDLFTFRDMVYGKSQFDHFFISSKMTSTKPLKIFDICNADKAGSDLELSIYNKTISDHCPVSAEIAL